MVGVLLILSLRIAARRASFGGLAGTLLAGQTLVDVVLEVIAGHPHPSGRLTEHLASAMGWEELVSGHDGTLAMLASHAVTAVIAAVVLHACESHIWARFWIDLLRLIRPVLFPRAVQIPPFHRSHPIGELLVPKPAYVGPWSGCRAPPAVA